MTGTLGFYGQIVIGSPGSGKTTYTSSICQFLTKVGRDVFVINLDPANDFVPYKDFCHADINELIRLEEVMDSFGLGPNGGLLYCMAFMLENITWLEEKIQELNSASAKPYLLFDCPGQIELYTNDESTRKILNHLVNKTSKLGLRLTAVNLIDSHYCTDPGNFISALMTSLCSMLQLGLPHVNVLSKADLLSQFGPLPFNLDYFTEVLDLNYLIDTIEDVLILKRYKRLNNAIANLVQDYSLVKFVILDIQNYQSLNNVLANADRASGYIYNSEENKNIQSIISSSTIIELAANSLTVAQEKYT